jgi:predicted metal-dependent phosphoesterase TrpH
VLKVDLHLHTSDDPVDNIRHDVWTLIDRAAELRFDALAITLHDRQFASPAADRYARERGIVLIPGIERTIGGRHVLLLNFPAEVENVTSFEDVARLKARSNGIVVAPHLFFPAFSCLGRVIDKHAALFDAIEWSYFWTPWVNFNAPAARWAREHGKPLVGNSDCHDLRQLGRTYSMVIADRDRDAICASIRDGRVVLETQPVPTLELTRIASSMLLNGRKRQPASQPLPQQL